MNLSIEKKILIILAFGLFCLAFIGYRLAGNATLRSVLEGFGTPDNATAAVITSLRASIKDLETAELGYVLSGRRDFLNACRSAAAKSRKALRELDALSPDELDRRHDVAYLESLVAERIGFTELMIDIRRKGGLKKAEGLLRGAAGRRMSERIETVVGTLDRAGTTASADRSRNLGLGLKHSVLLGAAGYIAAAAAILFAMSVAGFELLRRRPVVVTRRPGDRYLLLTEELRDCALCQLGPDGTITQWEPAAERLEGYTQKDVLGRPFSWLFPTEEARLGKPDDLLKRAREEGRQEQAGPRVKKDGSIYQAQTVVTPLRDRDGTLEGYSIVTRDITESKRNEELLKRLSLTVEQSADLIVITDRKGGIEFVNKAVEEVTGYTREEFIAGGLELLQDRSQDAVLRERMWETVLAGDTFQAEVTAVRKNGEFIYLDQVATPIKDGPGRVTHVVFNATDLTPIRLMRNKLDYLASYDSLTGLPNRDLFADRLSRDTTRENAAGGALAVLAIDIDRFKYINEIYGLDAGNKVLKQVAESLSVSVSKGDTVGRLGSDEFGIILHDIQRPADVVLFVKMIMKNVPQIIMSGGEEISVTLTAGIAVYPADGRDQRTLMKNADTALSKAKAQGRNHFQFYTADMNVGISELVFMERRLSDALRNKEYILTFQPYCNMESRRVVGAEALLKWTNEEFGQVSPAKFIPLLEETGMIIDVGKWVLRTACCQIRDWSRGAARFPVAVNLSPSQFRHEYLVETIESGIHDYGIDPKQLTLEVTESTFMNDQDFAVGLLRRLKSLGVSLAIDDFGTGYSSLSYLKKFPVDFVKIDRSFVSDVATDPDTTSLVTAIISMAHGLNLRTIAEGVETEEQWKILRLLKCDLGQGFYFSPALTVQDFEKLIV